MQKIDRAPRISVIIPTHNRADFIGETIRSVLNQTYTDWELIILDDASTDETPQVVAQFKDERITYIYRENNVGETAARNAAFAYAQGELLSFLDSDDLLLPHNLEILVTLLDARPKVDIAYGWYYWIDKDGMPNAWQGPEIIGDIPPQLDTPWPDVTLRPNGPTLDGQIVPQLLLEESFMIGSSLIRRECVEAIGGFSETIQFQGHWDFHLRLARAGYVFACSKQGVALWRKHAGNRGLNKEAMLAHRIKLLDGFFNDPTLKVSLASVRRQAYYNAYIEGAQDFYSLGNLEQGVKCLHQAFRYLPEQFDDMEALTTNCIDGLFNERMQARRSLDNLVKVIALFAYNPAVNAPTGLESDIFTSPIPRIGNLRRKVIGQTNADIAFRYHQIDEPNQTWRYALKAVIQDPAWLYNRGLVRIGLKGFISDLIKRQHTKGIIVSNDLLNTASKTTCIFISPHFDDAALSCGGTLAHLAQRGADILLVTVFSADLPKGAQIPPLAQEFHKMCGEDKCPFKMRRLEEQKVAEYLDARYCWLDFLDGVYRYPQMKDWKEQFSPDFEAGTDICFEPVRNTLLQIITEHPSATIFAPLGLGYHRDHLIVHQALEEIRKMTLATNKYYYYEDYPYAATANLHGRLKQLNWPAKALSIDIKETLAARIHMIKMYTSQLNMLFGGTERIYGYVEHYATRVGTKNKPQERFWLPRQI